MALLEFGTKGIYCPAANVYIDPWKPVDGALITHGHSDHARWGHKRYLCTHDALPVIKYRLGDIAIQGIAYNEPIYINGVRFSFHPAGHVPGSAQIRVEHQGEVWVASGDYKTEADGYSAPFEPVGCHAFITESTFGLPIYRWQPQTEIMEDINTWWIKNRAAGKTSVLIAYALGKAQRILSNIDPGIGPIFTHGAVENINAILRGQGFQLPDTQRVSLVTDKKSMQGGLIIAPPSAFHTPWLNRFKPMSLGIASGWMALRGARRRRAADRGFVLSDHADWEGLNTAILATGADKVFVTHGYTEVFSQWLRSQGLDARKVETQYEGESLDQVVEEKVEEEGNLP